MDVSEDRLCQIIRDGNRMKEQAVADLDYEEAALWRDAVELAKEVLDARQQLGEPGVDYGSIKRVANRESLPTQAFSVAMARELRKRLDSDRHGKTPYQVAVEEFLEQQGASNVEEKPTEPQHPAQTHPPEA